jgi:hypothetical protein
MIVKLVETVDELWEIHDKLNIPDSPDLYDAVQQWEDRETETAEEEVHPSFKEDGDCRIYDGEGHLYEIPKHVWNSPGAPIRHLLLDICYYCEDQLDP